MAAKETALTIKRNFPRAAQELVQKFGNLPTGNVCDAQGRVGALDYRIKPVSETTQFCGTALTVDSGPRDNLAAWAALDIAKPGDVILITTGGHLDSSVAGDLYVGMAKNAGVAAIVTDGVVRDLPGINTVGIPVFVHCAGCDGSGREWLSLCLTCQGQGMIETEQTISVQLPPGVRDGTIIEVPLRRMGIHNFYLRLHIRVTW